MMNCLHYLNSSVPSNPKLQVNTRLKMMSCRHCQNNSGLSSLHRVQMKSLLRKRIFLLKTYPQPVNLGWSASNSKNSRWSKQMMPVRVLQQQHFRLRNLQSQGSSLLLRNSRLKKMKRRRVRRMKNLLPMMKTFHLTRSCSGSLTSNPTLSRTCKGL